MKNKLTSTIMAAILSVSLTLPALAADSQGICPSRQLLWQLLERSLCQSADCASQPDWNALLSRYLGITPSIPAPQEPAEQPTEPKPVEPKPVEPKPVEPKPVEPKPVEQQPVEQKPVEQTPVEQTPTEQPGEAAISDEVRAYEREVVRLVNEERAKRGLTALEEDAELSRIARLKSEDMRANGYFDHNSPTYGTPFQMLKANGVRYRTAGENIAMGYATPELVVQAWMNSASHRANILNATYTTIGVGYVPEGHYCTQHFLAPA